MRPRLRRLISRVTAAGVVVALLLLTPLPQRASAQGFVPQGFANAVAQRVNLLAGRQYAAPGTVTFAALEQEIGNFATGTDGTYVVDPTTGKAWASVATLLQRASGEPAWLSATHTVAQRDQQIAQVFGLLTWRVGFIEQPETPFQAVQYGVARSSVEKYPNPAFTYSNGDYNVTPAMRTLWSSQAREALAANPYMPSPGGYTGLFATINTGRGTSEVDIERQVDVVPLAKYAATQPSLYEPLAKVPISGGELFVEQQWGVIPRSPAPYALAITAVAKPVSANYVVHASDENFVGGTSLGTGTEVDPSMQMWARQLPDSVFEQPGTASNPVFVAGVMVRYNAPEPPPGWPPTSFGFFPANVYFVNTVVERLFIYDEGLPPLVAQPTFVRISNARFDFDARVARERAALASLAEQLGRQHLTAEQAVIADKQRAEQAEKDVAATSAVIASVLADYKVTLAVVAHLKDLEQQMGEEVRGLLANEAAYNTAIANLEGQILLGALTGDALSNAQRQLSTKRSGLAAIEGALADKFNGTPAGKERTELIARLQGDGQRLFTARAQQLAALNAETTAQTDLEVDRTTVGVLDRELMHIAEKLAGFDPEVIEITASVDGHEVFLGNAPFRYIDLYKLNQMIAQEAAIIDQLKPAKQMVMTDMLSAGKDVVASGDALASTLNKLAYARYATDVFFEAADLGEAFLVKGGLVGLASEAAKKVAEKWTIQKLGLDKTPAGPGSIEAQINQQYQAGLPDAWGPSTLINKAAEKDLKLVLFKAPKDAINASIGQLVFKKIGKEWRFELLAPGYALKYGPLGGAAEQIRQFDANLKELKKGAVEGFSLKSIAKGLVKDVAKNAVKWLLDKIEADAWADYAAKDMVWRDWLPLYHIVSNDYETAEESRDKLLLEKANLLAGLNPESSVTVLTSTKFESTATVTITLTLDGAQDPADPLEVLVDGVKATRVGNTNNYEVDASNVRPHPDGTLTIVLQ